MEECLFAILIMCKLYVRTSCTFTYVPAYQCPFCESMGSDKHKLSKGHKCFQYVNFGLEFLALKSSLILVILTSKPLM